MPAGRLIVQPLLPSPERAGPTTATASPPEAASKRATPKVGRRTELACYTIAGQARVLFGQRVDGVVRVTDVPASGRGRAYLIERGLEQDGNGALRALVDDYVQQAERHREIPMSAPTQRWLNHAENPHE